MHPTIVLVLFAVRFCYVRLSNFFLCSFSLLNLRGFSPRQSAASLRACARLTLRSRTSGSSPTARLCGRVRLIKARSQRSAASEWDDGKFGWNSSNTERHDRVLLVPLLPSLVFICEHSLSAACTMPRPRTFDRGFRA